MRPRWLLIDSMSTARRGRWRRRWVPKLGVGPETLRKWVVRAQTDAGARPRPTSDELAEIKRLKKENADLREANEILKAASIFFARELDPRQR